MLTLSEFLFETFKKILHTFNPNEYEIILTLRKIIFLLNYILFLEFELIRNVFEMARVLSESDAKMFEEVKLALQGKSQGESKAQLLNDNAFSISNSPEVLTSDIKNSFNNFYQKEVFEKIADNNCIFQYFDEAKMSEKNNQKLYESVVKVFTFSSDYSSIIEKKKQSISKLNTKLTMIKNNFISRSGRIVADLENNRLDNFFNLDGDLGECKVLLENSIELTNQLDNKKISVNDQQNLGRLFNQVMDIDFDLNRETLTRLSDEVRSAQKEFSDCSTQKLQLECEKGFHENRIKYIEESLRALDGTKIDYELNINTLEQDKNANDETKKDILKRIEVSAKNFQEENDKRKKQFDEDFASTLIKSQQVDPDSINDIKNLKTIEKKYHIIFVLDESSSMTPHFDSVRNCVYNVIKSRKSLPIAKDRVSIIKFNTGAKIEYLNEDISANIVIKDIRGGGTSFLKPLEELEKIFSEINSEIYVPIVFFLSDGYAEDPKVVRFKCEIMRKKFPAHNIIFFTVGYGENADRTCLSEMSTVFNNGVPLLKIGNEMCKLFHTAENKRDLLKVFEHFRKLFDLQKSLTEQKSDLMKSVYTKKIDEFKNNQQLLSDLNDQTEEYLKKKREASDKQIQIKNELNKEIDQTIKSIKDLLVGLEESKRKLQNEKENCQKEIGKIQASLEIEAEKKTRLRDKLNSSLKLYDELEKNTNAEIGKSIEVLRNQGNTVDTYVDDLRNMGVVIFDHKKSLFNHNFKDFAKNYSKLRYATKDHARKSVEIDNVYDIIISKMKDLNEKIQDLKMLYASRNLKNIIWRIILFMYENSGKIEILEGEAANDEMSLKNIMGIRLNFEERKLNVPFYVLFQYTSVSGLFSKMEEGNFNIETFFSEIIFRQNEAIRDLKKIGGDNQNEIQKLEEEMYKFMSNKAGMQLIFNEADLLRKEVKEYHIQEKIKKDVNILFSDFQKNYIPTIEVLCKEYRSAIQNQ